MYFNFYFIHLVVKHPVEEILFEVVAVVASCCVLCMQYIFTYLAFMRRRKSLCLRDSPVGIELENDRSYGI